MKKQATVAPKTFIGRCPFCKYLLNGMNVINYRDNPRKQKVECPSCGKRFNRKRAIKPRVRKDWRPARLPGFRRTRWGKDNGPLAAVDFFKHLLVLPLPTDLVEKRIGEYEQELLDEGWNLRQIVACQTMAAQQSLWSDSQYIKERFESIYMDKPLPMVISGRDKMRIVR
jgi:hypothetical protein